LGERAGEGWIGEEGEAELEGGETEGAGLVGSEVQAEAAGIESRPLV
jgi:hypothetical protein